MPPEFLGVLKCQNARRTDDRTVDAAGVHRSQADVRAYIHCVSVDNPGSQELP